MIHIESIEKIHFLKESPGGEHKSDALSHSLGNNIPVTIELVNAVEPNHLKHPTDLVGRKFNIFYRAWQPENRPGASELIVAADVTSEWQNAPARKPPKTINMADLPYYTAEKFKRKPGDLITLYEHAGLKFGVQSQTLSSIRTKTGISTTRVTFPLTALQDIGLLKEYFASSGLGEQHLNMPSVDSVTFLPFLYSINQLRGAFPKHQVVVSAGYYQHAKENPKYLTKRLEYFSEKGRVNKLAMKYLDPFTIVALCESAVNMPTFLIHQLISRLQNIPQQKEPDVTTH